MAGPQRTGRGQKLASACSPQDQAIIFIIFVRRKQRLHPPNQSYPPFDLNDFQIIKVRIIIITIPIKIIIFFIIILIMIIIIIQEKTKAFYQDYHDFDQEASKAAPSQAALQVYLCSKCCEGL